MASNIIGYRSLLFKHAFTAITVSLSMLTIKGIQYILTGSFRSRLLSPARVVGLPIEVPPAEVPPLLPRTSGVLQVRQWSLRQCPLRLG